MFNRNLTFHLQVALMVLSKNDSVAASWFVGSFDCGKAINGKLELGLQIDTKTFFR